MDFLQAVEFHKTSSWFCNDITSKRKLTKILTPPRQLRLTRCKCYITININPSRNERPWRNFKQWSLIVLSRKECNNGASPWFTKNNFFPIESFTSIRLNSDQDPRSKFVSGYEPLYADLDPSFILSFQHRLYHIW